MRRRISIRGRVGPSVPCFFWRWKIRVLGASCAVYPALFSSYVDFRPYSGAFPAFLFSHIFSFLSYILILFFPEHFEWLTSFVPQFVEKILPSFLKNRHRKVYFPTLSSLPSQPHASQSNLKGVDDFWMFEVTLVYKWELPLVSVKNRLPRWSQRPG